MEIVKMVFGSHLYGLNTKSSDTDYKGIFLPTKEQVLLGKIPRTQSNNTGSNDTKNTSDDVDFESFSLHEFVRLALRGETIALDMLHARTEHVVSFSSDLIEIFEELQSMRHEFYSKDMKAYLGYVRRQAAKYGVKGGRLEAAKNVLNKLKYYSKIEAYVTINDIRNKLPIGEHVDWVTKEEKASGKTQHFYEVCGRKIQSTLPIPSAIEIVQKIVDGYGERAEMAENNKGIDWKAVSHALRAGYQLRDIYKKGDFEYPLNETSFLLDVKSGNLDFKTQVQLELENLVKEVEELAEHSSYPDKPDHEKWETWLMHQMEKHVI